MNDRPRRPELAARITAADAARKDFHHAVDAYLDAGGPEPDWKQWAFRLTSEVASLTGGLPSGPGDKSGVAQPGGGWISGTSGTTP